MDDLVGRLIDSGYRSKMLFAPTTDMFFSAKYLDKNYDDLTLEEEVCVSNKCGLFPLLNFGIRFCNYSDSITWKAKVIDSCGDMKKVRYMLESPCGAVDMVLAEGKHMLWQIGYPLKSFKDYEVLFWYLDEVKKSSEAIRCEVDRALDAVKGIGVLMLRLSHPFSLFGGMTPKMISWISIEDMIFHSNDDPYLYKEAMERELEATKFIIDESVNEGARLFFLPSFGLEILSPKLMDEYVWPYTKEIFSYIKKKGGFSVLHLCGKMARIVDSGVINDLEPSIVEGFAPPPTGDIGNFFRIRSKIKRSICTKGNLDMNLLRNGPVEEIVKETKNLIESAKGYPHIMGTCCSVLQDTPLMHLRAVANVVENFL